MQNNNVYAYIGAFALITMICGLAFTLNQQSYRQSANDPQIQMAEDTASALESGKRPYNFDSPSKVNMAVSLAPYLIIYDTKGQPIASTGVLDGSVPVVPFGVLQVAGQSGENRVTWQPRVDVRTAIVVVPFHGQTQSGFVVAGRSLREVEVRENKTALAAGLFWVAGLLATLVSTILLYIVSRFHSKKNVN